MIWLYAMLALAGAIVCQILNTYTGDATLNKAAGILFYTSILAAIVALIKDGNRDF